MIVAALAMAPGARAETGRLADFSAKFTTRYPSTPSGLEVHVFLKRADDPDAKPSPLRSAVIRGPDGLRFDTGAMNECEASDDELRALGADACPDDTLLTVGSFSAMGGFGPADPIAGDNHVFNGPEQIIEVITVPDGSASPAFDRLTIDGSTLTAHPPVAPGGPPDGESSVRSLDYAIPVRRGAGGRSFLTTPPSCPSGGEWKTVATFGFKDGMSDSVTSVSPCATPRLSLTVKPGRVLLGKKTRLRFRVTSPSPACIAGATIRLGKRTVRTGPGGRAALSATFRNPGARRARATRPGCRAARAPVHVRRG
jgi:hypothetical protein